MSDLVSPAYLTVFRVTKNADDTFLESIQNGIRKTTAISNSDGSYDAKIGSIIKPWLVEGFTTVINITEDNNRTIFDAYFGRVRQTYVLYSDDGSYSAKHGSIILDAKTANQPNGWV